MEEIMFMPSKMPMTNQRFLINDQKKDQEHQDSLIIKIEEMKEEIKMKKEEAITKTEETRHQDHTVKIKEECQDLEEDPTSDAYYVT